MEDAGTFSRNGRSVSQILQKKYELIEWDGAFFDAFDVIERTGVVFIYGNSGSGKTSFIMQLMKKLSEFGKVAFVSLEEGQRYTMQKTLLRYGMNEINSSRFAILEDSIHDLDIRLHRQRSPDFVIIDSFQYTDLNFKQYKKFKKHNQNKLIIFTSWADGNKPAGRTAISVMYDADLKIYIEGYRAFSKGRYWGKVGHFDIWPERAQEYWANRKLENS